MDRLADALDPLANIVTVPVDNTRTLRGEPLTVRDKLRNPLGIKTLMQGLGMIANGCRRPLGRMTPAGVQVVRAAARTVWDNSPDILRPIEDTFDVSIPKRLDDDDLWTSLAYPTA